MVQPYRRTLGVESCMTTIPKIGAQIGTNRYSDGRGGAWNEEQYEEWLRVELMTLAKAQAYQRAQRGR
jgi:hypothetical protein